MRALYNASRKAKILWGLHYFLWRGILFTFITAAYLTSFPATVFVALLLGISTISSYTLRHVMLYKMDDNPTQGRWDKLEREGILGAILGPEIMQGRTLHLAVMKGDKPFAFSTANRKRIRIGVSQKVWDADIDVFMGTVLHEGRHAKNRIGPHRVLALATADMAWELAIAATGLTFAAALSWAVAGFVLVTVPTMYLLMKANRRRELECDAYAQSKGGNIRGSLQGIQDQMQKDVGFNDFHPLPFGLESIFSTHPSFRDRYKALDGAPTGTLNLYNYTPRPAIPIAA